MEASSAPLKFQTFFELNIYSVALVLRRFILWLWLSIGEERLHCIEIKSFILILTKSASIRVAFATSWYQGGFELYSDLSIFLVVTLPSYVSNLYPNRFRIVIDTFSYRISFNKNRPPKEVALYLQPHLLCTVNPLDKFCQCYTHFFIRKLLMLLVLDFLKNFGKF